MPGEAEVDAGVARLLEEVAAMQLRRTGEVLDAVLRRGAALLGGKGGKGGKHVHASFVARRGGAAAERAEKAGKEVGLSVRVAGCGWQQPLPASEELAPSRSLLRSGLSPRLNAIGSLVFLVSVAVVLLLEILVFRKRP